MITWRDIWLLKYLTNFILLIYESVMKILLVIRNNHQSANYYENKVNKSMSVISSLKESIWWS